jgi:signal transduction histidine kinase
LIEAPGMTKEAILYIFLFLLGTTVINFAVAIVARLKTGHKEFNSLILYWVSLFLMFGAIANLEANETQIAFAYFFQFVPSIIITRMLRNSVGIKTSLKYFCSWQLAGMAASTYLLLYSEAGFTLSLLPVTMTTALPFFAPTWITLFSSRRRSVNWVEKVMGLMFVTAIVNHFNYAFFRLDPDNAWWGWSLCFAQYQFLSVFLPLLINYRREEKERTNLKLALEKISGASKNTVSNAEDLYRELDHQIAQKEDFFNKLQATNVRLEDEQEMNEMLIRTISHDLANPLTVVNGYVSLIQTNRVQNDELPNIHQQIKVNLDLATNMIDRIRNAIVNRTQASLLSVSEVIVDDAIHHLLYLFDTHLRSKKLKVQYINPNSELKVKAEDKALTEHVLSNVISNAIKFSFENSSIMIRVTEEAEMVQISITDTGTGIDKDRLERRILATTSGTQGETGTGMGLVVMGYFVRKFEGTFNITSETEGARRGTTVTIALKNAAITHPVLVPPSESANIYN